MQVGIVEFTSEEPRLTGSLGGQVAWRSTSRELNAALARGPVDAVVFHVKLDDRNDLVETLRRVKELEADRKRLGGADQPRPAAELSDDILSGEGEATGKLP